MKETCRPKSVARALSSADAVLRSAKTAICTLQMTQPRLRQSMLAGIAQALAGLEAARDASAVGLASAEPVNNATVPASAGINDERKRAASTAPQSRHLPPCNFVISAFMSWASGSFAISFLVYLNSVRSFSKYSS